MHLTGHVGEREIDVVGIGPGRGQGGGEEHEYGHETHHDRDPSVWRGAESTPMTVMKHIMISIARPYETL